MLREEELTKPGIGGGGSNNSTCEKCCGIRDILGIERKPSPMRQSLNLQPPRATTDHAFESDAQQTRSCSGIYLSNRDW